MAFKSEKQRRCVMALLNKNMTNSQFKSAINIGVKQKTITTKQRVKILNSDFDKDGVKNSKDCQPLNKMEQGKIHKLTKKIRQSSDFKKLSPKEKAKIEKALKELDRVDSVKGLKLWVKLHPIAVSFIKGAGISVVSLGAFVPGLIPFVTAITGGILAATQKGLESRKAEDLLDNRKTIIDGLQKKGFTKQQAKIILKGRISQLERKADSKRENREQRAETKRVNRLLKQV